MFNCITGKKNNNLHGCILADFMGLGKTLQTLVLAYSMIKQKLIKKFVIVCPLTLLTVWEK
jgi:SNF2 family DNA or RNA helicase